MSQVFGIDGAINFTSNGVTFRIRGGSADPSGVTSDLPGTFYIRVAGGVAASAYINQSAGPGAGTTWAQLGGSGSGSLQDAYDIDGDVAIADGAPITLESSAAAQPILRLITTAGGGLTSFYAGGSSPNGVISAAAGSIFFRASDGTSSVYINTSTGSGTTWTAVSAGSALTDGDKGDITVSSAGAAWAIDAGAVTLAKMADVATSRIIGRVTAGAGVPEALTGTQATTLLDAMVGDSGSGGLKGLVPAQVAGDALLYLRGDGAFAPPVWRYRQQSGSSYNLAATDHGYILQVVNSSTALDHVVVEINDDFAGLWVELLAPIHADIVLHAEDSLGDPAAYLNGSLDEITIPAGSSVRLIPLSPSTPGWRVVFCPAAIPIVLAFALSDAATTDIVSAADVVSFRAPHRFYIDNVRLELHRDHPSTTGAVSVQMNMLSGGVSPAWSTPVTIDEGATTSATSAVPHVWASVPRRLLNDDEQATFSIIDDGVNARGLVIKLIGRYFPTPIFSP